MAEDLERIEAVLAHLTKALSDLKFNRPVTGRSSRCPFEGQEANWLMLMCRVKRRINIPEPTQPPISVTPSSIHPLLDAVVLEFIYPQQKPVGSARHLVARG